MGPHVRRALVALAFIAGWFALAAPATYLLFFNASHATVLAGHDARVSPTHDGYVTVDLGAYLPNLRYPSDGTLGVRITVGKTNVDDYRTLLDRYALIASHPQGEVDRVRDVVRSMALESVGRGALIGLAGPALWLLLGSARRREIYLAVAGRRVALVAVGGVVAISTTTSAPLAARQESPTVGAYAWEPIVQYLSITDIPEQARRVEVQRGLITSGTQRLIESAVASYKESFDIYRDLAENARELGPRLHQPGPDEQVALLVTDRHDNIGMDEVALAIGEAGGATILFDAGDDTSTGEPWETFSLDSLATAFDDWDEKYVAPGNHDNGDFVGTELARHGFTVLDGEPVVTDEGIRLLGAPDPRSSGLGDWRTTSGISFEDQASQLADVACTADAAGERVNTLLVHDANLARPALERGCVDLVLAGHLHTQVGPDVVHGYNGQTGVTFTNGTTGGAAFAVALGSQLRRDAQVSLITYRDGVPVGIQPITIKTNDVFVVERYFELPTTVRSPVAAAGRAGQRPSD